MSRVTLALLLVGLAACRWDWQVLEPIPGPRLSLLAGSPAGPEVTPAVLPVGLAVDERAGTLFFTDRAANLVRSMPLAGQGQQVVPLAGSGLRRLVAGTGPSASLSLPTALELGPDGALYVGNGGVHAIARVSPAGKLELYAGDPAGGAKEATGPLASAGFNGVGGLAWSGGALIVNSRWGGKLYRLADGQSTWFCGAGLGKDDGPPATARLRELHQLVADPSSVLHGAEEFTHRLRRVSAAGSVSSLGSGTRGYLDGALAQARFNSPTGVASPDGVTLYVADSHNDRIRKIANGQVTTLAGSSPGYLDGVGAAARFRYPYSLRLLAGGDLLVSDLGNAAIRRVTPAGVVSTLIATPSIDGVGVAARFRAPLRGTLAPDGALLVADSLSHRVRRVTRAGEVTTVAGDGHERWLVGGPALQVALAEPSGVALDPAGNLYVAVRNGNAIVKVSTTGEASLLAGGACCTDDGKGAAAEFWELAGIVYAGGSLYVGDAFRVRRVDLDGTVTTIAGINSAGFADGTGTAARFGLASGIAVEATGALIVADEANHAIRRVTPAGEVTTVAQGQGHVDGPLAAARFDTPTEVAVGADGTIYVGELGNHAIRAIAPDGVVRTVLGGHGPGLVDGGPATARLRAPTGIVPVDARTLFVIERDNHAVRLLQLD